KKYREAIKCFDEILEVDPRHAETLYNKGKTLQKLGKYFEARTCFDEAAKIDPHLQGNE
ncbi:MAG: tetratricopeptide repeat protein, partial [Theionarchaea archaeon]|nr:tetratricopeptide repeat protein [Theionarchaea archaeon]